MTRFRLLLIMAVLIGMQRSSTAQFLAESVAIPRQTAQSAAGEETPPTSITIPAGTTVLTSLRSPLHTVSARTGSGLYLQTTRDVIQQNHLVIPARTFVQGVVEKQARPGRARGRGQLQFHLTSLILPDNYTVSIAGSLQSLPGSRLYESANREGAIQPVDQIDKDTATILSGVAAGAALGALSRGGFGAGIGALIGAGFGAGKVLFKRGDDISLPIGTPVEMVLDRSVTIPIRELTAYTHRLQVPGMKQAPFAALPDRETPFRRPNSASVAISPEPSPEVRFHW